MNESEPSHLPDAGDTWILKQKTLLLASRSAEGRPELSYAPYVRIDGIFYIFVSQLAKHTHNLLSYPKASIMFIQPEIEAGNLFARKRLTFDCVAHEIPPADPTFDFILQTMTRELGPTVTLLRSLPDFHLLALTPEQGQWVLGFGQAFAVDAAGLSQPHPK